MVTNLLVLRGPYFITELIRAVHNYNMGWSMQYELAPTGYSAIKITACKSDLFRELLL